MDTGLFITKATAIAAFVTYITALMLHRHAAANRVWWTAGCLALLVHSVCAFHFVHHWSHHAAYESTAQQTAALTGLRSGSGLYLNYLLLLVWLGDTVWCWTAPARHAARSRWITWLLHSFLGFMWLNATVVFGHGMARWLGLCGFVALLIQRWRSRHTLNPRS
ncbi:MAG: hypothetical protein ACKVY0_08000 [Prosthecobacter sp.]|uniref:hypothetical protein n=1 Tax=Prosthecobacter sp. TaxID=1965333 RepID=UPI003900EB15